MNHNIGTVDRTLRIVIGIALLALAALGKIGWWGYFGMLPFLTGIFRFCPLYSILGFRSCAVASTKR